MTSKWREEDRLYQALKTLENWPCLKCAGLIQVAWISGKNTPKCLCYPAMPTITKRMHSDLVDAVLAGVGGPLPELPKFIVKEQNMTSLQRGRGPAGAEELSDSSLIKFDAGTKKALTIQQATALRSWAEERGLDPESGHALMMHGKPYVTIEGVMYHLATRPSYRKMFLGYQSRFLNSNEKADGGYGPKSVVKELTLHLVHPESGLAFDINELGAVTDIEIEQAKAQIVENMTDDVWWEGEGRDRRPSNRHKWDQEGKPVEWQKEYNRRLMILPILRDPGNMAEKRALHRAVKRGFPIGPIADELRDLEPEERLHTDPATGEVLDGVPRGPEWPAESEPPEEPGTAALVNSAPPDAKPAEVTPVAKAPPAAPAQPTTKTLRRYTSYDAFIKDLSQLGLDEKTAAEVLVVGKIQDIQVADLAKSWAKLEANAEGR